MLEAKDAAKIAAEYYREITQDTSELTIEEVELDDKGLYWFITLGISDPYSRAIMPKHMASYKIFKIDVSNSKVISMKIRTLK